MQAAEDSELLLCFFQACKALLDTKEFSLPMFMHL
jgi:hypothetical protein